MAKGKGLASLSVHVSDLLSQHVHRIAVGTVDLGEHQEDFVASLWLHVSEVAHAVTTDASCKVHVLLHDGHPFRMDCAQVGVFEKTDDVGL